MKKVLIIEDKPRIRKIYSAMLQMSGIEALEANDAWEAADAIIFENVDLILLDLNPPEIDGSNLFRIVQEHNPNIKIMIASVYPIEKQKEMAPAAIDYFDKSQGSHVLLEKVNYLLSN